MADTTHEALRAHIEKWRGTARRKGPGFNSGPIDQLREELAWTLRKIDELREAASNSKTMRKVRAMRNGEAARNE